MANNNSNPTWIAYDVLAQGEHDPNAKTYVLSKSKNILIKVKNELKRIMEETKFKNVDHVHFFGYYIGNYPSLERKKIKKLCNIINSV